MCLVTLRLFLYKKNFFKQTKLPVKVISVGNISLGGNGKTPFVILLESLLYKQNKKIAVIEKGYKSGLKNKDGVVLVKKDSFIPNTISDEPLLVYNNLHNGSILSVHNNKTVASINALKLNHDTDFIIIDDGFQHLKLFRNKDIVLIQAGNNIFKEQLIPKGKLRESYSSLKRADIVVITKTELVDDDTLLEIKSKIKQINNRISLFCAKTNLTFSNTIKKGSKIIPVSALASSKHFHKSLKDNGLFPLLRKAWVLIYSLTVPSGPSIVAW